MFGKVYEAFLDYELILFRDVDLPPATQVAFARTFGEMQIHVMNQYQNYPEHPEIYMLTNADKDGKPTGKHPDKGTLYWHTDGSWRERTGQATMMYSEIVPPVGGETEFADMYAAYDNLPAAMKKKIEGKRAIHNLDFLAHAPPRRGPDDGGAEGRRCRRSRIRSCARIPRPAARRSSSATTRRKSRAWTTTKAAR